MFNVNILAQQLNNVKWIQSVPHLIIITTDDQICEEINNILAEFNGRVFFTYDTTFNIGDFLVSPLLCRHPFLEDDMAFPVAYLFHDSKEEMVHDIFFRWVTKVNLILLKPNTIILNLVFSIFYLKTFPLIKSKGLCATDGERAIINSLNGIENLRCWNHLLNNIEYCDRCSCYVF